MIPEKIQLRPVIHKDGYTFAIRRPIAAFFDEVLFTPLRAELTPARANALTEQDNALIREIRAGRITFKDGSFQGSFNASTSRVLHNIGAKFRTRSATWNISLDKVPPEVRQAIYLAREDSKAAYAAAIALLLSMRGNASQAEPMIDLTEPLRRVTSDAHRQFVDSVTAAKLESVSGEMPSNIENLKKEVTRAVNEDAKKALGDEIDALVSDLQKSAIEGASLADLKKTLDEAQERAKRRANDIAEQAASLTLSEMRQDQAASLGSGEYVWITKRDDRVRPYHRVLEGTIQRWDSPPVTNKDGAHNHPGEDFNCRCAPGLLILR